MGLRAVAVSHEVQGAAEPRRILDDVHLDVPDGDAITIRGPSGAGKSTLLRLLATLDRPTAGRIEIDGDDASRWSARRSARHRRRRVGLLRQSADLIADLTVVENVAMPLLLDGRPPRPALTRAADVIDQVGLAARTDDFPPTLSGGEAARVALARALVAAPAFVLADEPTGELDPTTGAHVLDLLFGALRDGAIRGLVIVTHDAVAAARGDARYHLRDGRLAAADAPVG